MNEPQRYDVTRIVLLVLFIGGKQTIASMDRTVRISTRPRA